MTQELRINGHRVDLMPDENITLNYRSNLFGDIDKITSSSSLTIRLPKTPLNNFVVNFADAPFSTSDFARRWYSAEYRRNGVLLVNGRATLLSADEEAYEISLVWGVFTELGTWLNAGTTLRDLPLTYQTGIRLNNLNVFSKYMGILYGLYWYNNGGEAYVFPVVQVHLIFNLILQSMSSGRVDTSGVDMEPLKNYYINFNDDLVRELGADGTSQPNFAIRDYIPEIKQVDFVKAICHIMGWYIERTSYGLIKLVAIDDAIDKTKAIDWSGKLATAGILPIDVEYTFGDYAQRNWMRYKEDEEVTTNADGYVDVDDETLEVDKTLFTLPFAPTNGAFIRQYLTTIDDDGDSSTDFIKTEPRILVARPDGVFDDAGNEIPSLSFDNELYFRTIISEKYQKYKDVIKKPLVISADFKLTEFDLADLDFSKPVYISQYGSHFAIIELQNTGEITRVKLIKIP